MLERIEELVARHLSSDDPLYSRHERYRDNLLNNGTSNIKGNAFDCNLEHDAFPDNIEKLMPIVQKKIEPLPERSRIVFNALLKRNNNSLAELYGTISDPSFGAPPLPFSPNWYFYRGNRLINEKISEIKSFLNQFREKNGKEKVEWALRDENLSYLLPENYKKRKAYELERILGYFPGYYLAWEVIQNMKIEELEFIDECIPYKEGQHLLSSVDYSAIYYVSQGSVHQKKRRVLASLEKELKKVRAFLDDNTCHYSVTSESFLKNVNSMEDTGFDGDFLRWMTSVLYDGFHLIGNPVSVLSIKPVGRKSLTLVPSDVMDEFDVDGFIEGIGERVKQKRTDNQSINLEEIIIPYLKKGATTSQVIEELSIGIIKDEFSLAVEKMFEKRIDSFRSKYWYRVLFKANSYKSFPVIIYEILLKRGSPLTERQIASAIKKEYPERRFSKGAIGANALRHPDIVRSSKKPNSFALREW